MLPKDDVWKKRRNKNVFFKEGRVQIEAPLNKPKRNNLILKVLFRETPCQSKTKIGRHAKPKKNTTPIRFPT